MFGSSLGLRRLRVKGLGLRVQGSGFRGLRAKALGFRVQGSGFRGLRVRGLGFRGYRACRHRCVKTPPSACPCNFRGLSVRECDFAWGC